MASKKKQYNKVRWGKGRAYLYRGEMKWRLFARKRKTMNKKLEKFQFKIKKKKIKSLLLAVALSLVWVLWVSVLCEYS